VFRRSFDNRTLKIRRARTTHFQQTKGFTVSKEQENKAIVGRWFKEFWGNPWNPNVVDELATPDI
jgi:hypothetical protein